MLSNALKGAGAPAPGATLNRKVGLGIPTDRTPTRRPHCGCFTRGQQEDTNCPEFHVGQQFTCYTGLPIYKDPRRTAPWLTC